jgi:transposase
VELLKHIKGVGTLIALTFLLTLEDPHHFQKSRDVGGYLGLQPGRRKSGESAVGETERSERLWRRQESWRCCCIICG